ncbi:Uncharacterised protein [Mycobacterium tuberculosis]|nr:Uncharacterised protein [Mycobacterium tuberculosis]
MASRSFSASKPAIACADQPDSVAWNARLAQAAPASKECHWLGAASVRPGNRASRCETTTTSAAARFVHIWLNSTRLSKMGCQAGVSRRA